MRPSLLVAAIICCITSLKAQSLQYFSGQPIEKYDEKTFTLFQQDSTSLYAFHFDKKHYFLEAYDKESLKNIRHIQLPLPEKDSVNFQFETLFLLQDKYLVFYSFFDKSISSNLLAMMACKLSGERIGDIKIIDSSSGKNQRRAGGFELSNHPQKNEFVSYGYKSNKGVEYINIDHFDYAGNKIQTQAFQINENQGYAVFSRFIQNSLFLLKRSKLRDKNNHWSVNFYSPELNEPQKVALNLPSEKNIYLSNMFRSYTDDENKINILSPYTSTPNAKNATGLYLAQIDPKNFQLIKEAAIPFESGEDKVQLSSCILVAAIPQKDGGIKAVFESRLKETVSMYGVPVNSQYSIGDIIVTDITNDYHAKNIYTIHKQQIMNTATVKFSGFAVLKASNHIYYIYNDLPENVERTTQKIKKLSSSKMSKTVVVASDIENNEMKTSIVIPDNPDYRISAIMPGTKISDKYQPNTIYLLKKDDDNVCIIKIFIKE